MVRLTDTPEGLRSHRVALACPRYDTQAWVTGAPLAAALGEVYAPPALPPAKPARAR